MKILLVTPAPPKSRKGNRVTALRWARMLRQLGHRVKICQEYQSARWDLLIALHARRSFPAIERCHRDQPNVPIVVALTGTDLYEDLRTSPAARQALEWASRLIVLQPLAARELPKEARAKTRVVYQSAVAPPSRAAAQRDHFDVCVMGHLRAVKDPLQTAWAARLLPASSRVRVLHLGAALEPNLAEQARAESQSNPRYLWLGERPRGQALRVLSRCRLLVISSRLEGGANVLSEAVAASVPVISSRIDGSVGILGEDYPGYYPVGDTQALAALLARTEAEPAFYRELKRRCLRLKPLVDPARELRTWKNLLRELTLAKPARRARSKGAR